jgi:phage gpG-like protein
MKPDQFKKYFADLKIKLNQALKYDIPKKIGNNAVSLFKDNFQKESFFGKKWDEVLRRKSRTVSYKTKSGKSKEKKATFGKGAYSKRKILTGATKQLGRSIRYKADERKVVIYSDLEYSKIHNEGGKITVTKKMKKYFWAMYMNTNDEQYKMLALMKEGKVIKMPKRQFIGSHRVVDDMVKKTIEESINNIFKK